MSLYLHQRIGRISTPPDKSRLKALPLFQIFSINIFNFNKMKTNQIMKRPMGKFEVQQRTKDGFFNATSLLKQWNKQATAMRKLDNYFASEKTQEFIKTIMERENLNTPKMVYLKTRGKYNGGTWMSPLLFIDFAMWINPSFKYDVLKFVYDQLIKFRHDAGDNYNVLTSAIAALPNVNYKEVATAMNWIVFNKNGKNLRQSATQQQLQELSYTEHTLASMVDLGVINNYTQLIKTMRNMYFKKYQKF